MTLFFFALCRKLGFLIHFGLGANELPRFLFVLSPGSSSFSNFMKALSLSLSVFLFVGPRPETDMKFRKKRQTE